MPNSRNTPMRHRLRTSYALVEEMITMHVKIDTDLHRMKMNERAYLGVLIHLRRLFHCCCFFWNRYQVASNYPHFAHFPFMTDKSNDFCDLFDIQVQRNRLVLLLIPLHCVIYVSFAVLIGCSQSKMLC